MSFYWRILTCVVVFVKISTQTTQIAHESFEDGLIGCRFEQSLCKEYERCLDDEIFGRCLTPPSNYGRSVVGGRKERMILSDDDLATLERTFIFLKNSGARWRNKETQCILRYVLNLFRSEDLLIPNDCDELENIIVSIQKSSESEPELDEKAPRSWKVSPVYIEDPSSGDTQGILPKEFGNAVDEFYQENPDQIYALPVEFENNDSTATFISPLEQFDTILFSDEENPKGILLKRTENGLDSLEFSDEATNRANKDGYGFRFERQERLDVKKPGPWFAVNNFAFADSFDHYDDSLDDSRERFNPPERKELFFANNYRPAIPAIVAWKKLKSSTKNGSKPEKENDIAQPPPPPESNLHPITSEEITGELNNDKTVFSKEIKTGNPEASHPKNEEIVEASYVFITVKESFESWKEGAQLVNVLAQLLKVPPEAFNDVGVSGNQVSFRIMPNAKNVDPFKVVEKTDELRGSIRQLSGVEIDSIGIGDEAKVSSVLFRHQSNRQLFTIVVVCFVTTAALATVIILWLVRRRWLIRRKLKDVTSTSSQEVSRDYQDLCRARMASKTSDGSKDLPRISQPHLSRDSESSRSSTSSWCEEPVLTNMDISTGHMVLSYMEDHLRNRDRLDREWMALCAYEAEPCVSTNIGARVEFKEKNRYEDILPYDTSRVVLNSVANPGGFDYINASLIADHDPRHPAYIAAQAPMADSVADFWQMIWEQGTVVLVLLTRLTENGKEQCHLYWPTEGSQLYHIYEVHLVSEHIWCDDYLVRSFYLKNIRTGETRTVTQFHFLSWTENGVPASTRALLEFRRKINKSYRGRSSPILVHCSDGAGRTGTYCLIDMVLHRMAKGAREIDIAATLEHVRDQRMKAVRTKQQFEFVLTAVAEEVHAILRALPQ